VHSAVLVLELGAGGPPLAQAGFLGGARGGGRGMLQAASSQNLLRSREIHGRPGVTDRRRKRKVSNENCTCWQSGQCLACAVPYEYG
jgi:hypothetical protein